jgi:PTH1 family peptidyl-tRNA hydrolase
VGLGNPGPDYEETRHNIGFRLVDRLVRRWGARVEDDGPGAWLARTRFREYEVLLVKPLTWMNRSGDALPGIPDSREAGPERHLVVLDDVALPFGAVRFRRGGSSGGQKGLQSILDRLGTPEVPRLRLGIGGDDPGRDLKEYVLESFSEEEERAMEAWLDRAADGVEILLGEGIDIAMSRTNA